ncbi:hypothetical protein THAOC_32965 [Thalassiosira oceanica]|uniref:Uncharacterized protein n=1 Tax=Thalassiosira oceanica TaxID=159749 RepID=K0R845_THAOC|nr:hypothetical protein THAOC_32965 [Thalassiosira oceanica]|eukprot:EJK48254.1 hypothetical protein THAOC_32965 [Thalassiosira oceanica]
MHNTPPARSPMVSLRKNNAPPQLRPPAQPPQKPKNTNINSMKPFSSGLLPIIGRQAEAVDDDMQARWHHATLKSQASLPFALPRFTAGPATTTTTTTTTDERVNAGPEFRQGSRLQQRGKCVLCLYDAERTYDFSSSRNTTGNDVTINCAVSQGTERAAPKTRSKQSETGLVGRAAACPPHSSVPGAAYMT